MSGRRWLLLCGVLTVTASPLQAETPSAEEVIRRAETRLAALADYQCIAETESHAGSRAERGSFRIWFKPPQLLRVKVLEGKSRGSEVAVNARGEISGRKGGLLRAVVVRLKPSDSRIRSIRGVPVTALDWGSFYRHYHELAALPGTAVRLFPQPDPASPLEVEVRCSRDGHAQRETYRIDPKLWVMTEGEVFEDGARVDHVLFREIHLDTGLTEKAFRF